MVVEGGVRAGHFQEMTLEQRWRRGVRGSRGYLGEEHLGENKYREQGRGAGGWE